TLATRRVPEAALAKHVRAEALRESAGSPALSIVAAGPRARRSGGGSALGRGNVLALNHESTNAWSAGAFPLRAGFGTPRRRALLRTGLTLRRHGVVERHTHRIRTPALHPTASHVLCFDRRRTQETQRHACQRHVHIALHHGQAPSLVVVDRLLLHRRNDRRTIHEATSRRPRCRRRSRLSCAVE